MLPVLPQLLNPPQEFSDMRRTLPLPFLEENISSKCSISLIAIENEQHGDMRLDVLR